MRPHNPTLVNVAADADNASLLGVLPQDVVAIVVEHRRLIGIHRHHELITIKPAKEMLVVEITESIDEGLLMIRQFKQLQEAGKGVAEGFFRETASCLDVEHGDEVLFGCQTLSPEVF